MTQGDGGAGHAREGHRSELAGGQGARQGLGEGKGAEGTGGRHRSGAGHERAGMAWVVDVRRPPGHHGRQLEVQTEWEGVDYFTQQQGLNGRV